MALFYISYIIIMTLLLLFVIKFLSNRTNINQALSHPGTVMLIFYYLYCVVPTLFFLTETLDGAPVKWFLYGDEELKSHLIRSLVFGFTLALSICLFSRKNQSTLNISGPEGPHISITGVSVMIAIISLIIPNIILLYLAAPVVTYYDYYTRFDNLTGIPYVVSVVCKRMLWGFTPILIFVLAAFYNKNSAKYYICVAAIVVFTIINSYGARIDAILVVIQAISYRFLWNRKQIAKAQIAAIFPIAALAMYLLRYVEIIRLGTETNVNISFAGALLAAPGEFFAVMFPSIELYRLSTVESIYSSALYFKDLVTIIPFIDTSNYDLMYWYWKAFAPDAPVAPNTMGVLADPAILGQWWLIVEGIVIGKLANVVNNFRSSKSPYLLAAFGYLSSNGVLVLKYNMLMYIDVFINNFLLGAVLLWLILTIQKSARTL
jgi:heme/copper-type cytochrome/quinol oxidase subunit 2